MKNFTSILLTIVLVLFFSSECWAYKEFKSFKMVFLPDIYLSLDEQKQDGRVLYRESLVILQDVVKNINEKINPDYVVFGGNLTSNDDGEYSDLPMFLDTISGLKPRYYAIFGDREAQGAKEDFAREFDEFDYSNQKQTFWVTEPTENVLLIGLDTTVNGQEKGYMSVNQLFWLDTILKNNKDKFTIIAMHHSPHSSLEKPELFLQLLNLYPQVRVVISGHDLTTSVKKTPDGRMFITCPSIVAYPNQYKILAISPNKTEILTKKISFKQLIKKAKKSKHP